MILLVDEINQDVQGKSSTAITKNINEIIDRRFPGIPKVKVVMRLGDIKNTLVRGTYEARKKLIVIDRSRGQARSIYHEIGHALDYEIFKQKKYSKFELMSKIFHIHNNKENKIKNRLLKALTAAFKVPWEGEYSAFEYSFYTDQEVVQKLYRKALRNPFFTGTRSTPQEVIALLTENWFYCSGEECRQLHLPEILNDIPTDKRLEVAGIMSGMFEEYLASLNA